MMAPALRLTRREQQIAQLVADGLSTSAIARALGLAPNYVRNVLARLSTKLPGTGRLRVRIAMHVLATPGAASGDAPSEGIGTNVPSAETAPTPT